MEVIRACTPNDAYPIYELAKMLPPLSAHNPYAYWNLFSHFNGANFVAEVDGNPSGFITSHPTNSPESEWFIWQIGVLGEFRGTGLAAGLQDEVIDVARNSGAVAIRTTIDKGNPASLGSFKKMASRLGTELHEIDRYDITKHDPSVRPETLFRIPLI